MLLLYLKISQTYQLMEDTRKDVPNRQGLPGRSKPKAAADAIVEALCLVVGRRMGLEMGSWQW